MKRIGIFGGTFNPIHLGHLAISQMAQEKFKLNKVIFVPSFQPPHKKISRLVEANHRYAMVRLAIKDNPLFEISNFESRKKEKSYSIDTVKYFQKKYSKKTKLFFIIGGDMLPALNTWKNIDDILKIVSFIVVNRPGYDTRHIGVKHHPMIMPGIDIASSYLRRRIKQGKSIKYLVPDNVFRYIEKHSIY